MLARPSILSAPSLKEIQLALFELQLFTSQMAAVILNDINKSIDVHNPQTIPDVKFQTI